MHDWSKPSLLQHIMAIECSSLGKLLSIESEGVVERTLQLGAARILNPQHAAARRQIWGWLAAGCSPFNPNPARGKRPAIRWPSHGGAKPLQAQRLQAQRQRAGFASPQPRSNPSRALWSPSGLWYAGLAAAKGPAPAKQDLKASQSRGFCPIRRSNISSMSSGSSSQLRPPSGDARRRRQAATARPTPP